MLTVVKTEPQSAFEVLWRQFGQLKNATCVWYVHSFGGGYGAQSRRWFRLLDGSYVCTWSTEKNNGLVPCEPEYAAIFEGTWRALSGKIYDVDEEPERASGIRFASDAFFDAVTDAMDDLDNEGADDEEEDGEDEDDDEDDGDE
jgi:hypothetical protein